MKESTRGMVKYSPYQSLVEQAQYLSAMRNRRKTAPKKTIFSDEAEEMNEILVHYDGEEVIAEYWSEGRVCFIEGRILSIDIYAQALCIEGIRIPFRAMQGLKRAPQDEVPKFDD